MSVDGTNRLIEMAVECPRRCGRELVVQHEDLLSEFTHADTCRCQRNPFTVTERETIREDAEAQMAQGAVEVIR
jgi:hypothetical protein